MIAPLKVVVLIQVAPFHYLLVLMVMLIISMVFQPRDHKAKVCIWGDLNVADVDAICEVGTPDDKKRLVVCALLPLRNFVTNVFLVIHKIKD